MVYMKVHSETEGRLHLKRTPGIRSWSILIGFFAIGFGLWKYTVDSLPWKLLYISFCFMIGVTSIDDWEDCIIDKKKNEVRISKSGLIRKICSIVAPPNFQEVKYADVEEDVTKLGKGCYVVLRMESGMALPLTDTCTLGADSSEHRDIADKINAFLNLDRKEPNNIGYMEELSTSSSDSENEDSKNK
ncbi:cytochrome b-245 chaperone 1-like isoform X3 [Antedon mediterranea]|uniref:cytochrome b-245 chaperone 1-like isoform X3 n=1 Tax=Antedon mediterranea TaxID=105859 RepID=UPI003AF85355